MGPHIDAFESEIGAYSGVPHAVALASGTAAIDLALRLVGVERGDRVLVSSLTFVGSVGPVVHLGAQPVFVDSESETWNLDPDLVGEELERSSRAGTLPKAVVATDVYGQCADYDRLEPLCGQFGIPLIEDAAEALGASRHGRPAGSFGDCAIFSFNGNKIVTTSGGGMLVSENSSLISRARYLATQARTSAPHYEHDEVGFNYRMSNLCAAVGRGQLCGLSDKTARRREIHSRYRQALGEIDGVSFMPIDSAGSCNYWLTVILIDEERVGSSREYLREHLAAENIEARPAWKPMHLQPVFKDAESLGGEVSARIFKEGLCLPSGSGLLDSQVDRVIDGIREALNNPDSDTL